MAMLSACRLILVVGLCLIGQFAFASSKAQQCFTDPKLAYAFLLAQEQKSNNPIININTATPADFLSLKGVGAKTAQAIVDYRTTVGRFDSVDDLTHVKGIGQKTVDNNRHRLTVR